MFYFLLELVVQNIPILIPSKDETPIALALGLYFLCVIFKHGIQKR